MTYPTEAARDALAANGHEPKRVFITNITQPGASTGTTLQHVNGGFFWATLSGAQSGFIERCHPDDATNAVRCVMLDRLLEAGGEVPDGDGYLTADQWWEIVFLRYKRAFAHRTPATVGEVAAEPVSVTDELKGGAMPTNEEQYEAMVARGHHKDVPTPDTEYVTPTNLSQIYMMRQLGALEKAEWGYTRVNPERAWQASNGHVHVRADSVFDLYCKCFPLPSPPEPSEAEELAEAVKTYLSRCNTGDSSLKACAVRDLDDALAKYNAATAGGR